MVKREKGVRTERRENPQGRARFGAGVKNNVSYVAADRDASPPSPPQHPRMSRARQKPLAFAYKTVRVIHQQDHTCLWMSLGRWQAAM